MELQTFKQLLAPEGQKLLRLVAASELLDLKLATELRKNYSPDLVAAAMTTQELRGKARTKFGADAQKMYFTKTALEQATRSEVASYRAAKAKERKIERIADLGCSIGSDLIAFARAGISVRGVDRDELRVAMAEANLAALNLKADVQLGDATNFELAESEVAFIDPARRAGSRRTFQVRDMEPGWDFVVTQLRKGAIVKTLPGISRDDLVGESEWISHNGDLVEACLWGFGEVRRTATLLPSGAQLNNLDVSTDEVADVGQFIYEPDDAVVRAGLVQQVAAIVNGWRIDEHLAYVSSDEEIETEFANRFAVIAELPFHTKALTRELKERDIGTLTVKKRGVEIVPEKLIAQLKLRGDETATLIMTRVMGKGRAFLVEPQ